MKLIENEFSRPVSITNLPEKGKEVEISAFPAEREALAKRYTIEALVQLDAAVNLRPLPSKSGPRVAVSGQVQARIRQICVVSLEPMESRISAAFDVNYGHQTEAAMVDLDQEQAMDEPFTGDVIDIGETVASQLALEIPPYPRREGAEFQASEGPTDWSEKRENPSSAFSVLEKLSKKG